MAIRTCRVERKCDGLSTGSATVFLPEPLERRADQRRAACRGCSRPRARRRSAARRPRSGGRARGSRPRVTRMSASGSSTCASKPAETSTSSGSKRRERRLDHALERAQVLLVARAGAHRARSASSRPGRRGRRCPARTATGAARRRAPSRRRGRSPRVPLPWWTSKSTIASARRARARPAPSAPRSPTLLNRQKPIARSASAWWPGGRTSANPPRRTASIAPPAASSAAS